MGLVMGSSELFGGFLAPLLVGRAADNYGLAAPLAAQAVFALAAAVVILFITETAPAITASPLSIQEHHESVQVTPSF